MSHPIRTQDTLTAGLVCVPLSKPAIPFFIAKNLEDNYAVQRCLQSFNIPFTINEKNNKYFIKANVQVEPKIMRQIRRNFTTLRPKFISDWRYPLWEIDNKEFFELQKVLKVYAKHDLPVYVKQSMRGYHFICIVPVTKSFYLKEFVPQVRETNLAYPPIAIRIQANKYRNELDEYKKGFIMSANYHTDTYYFKKWVEAQDIDKIAQNYYVVRYPLPPTQRDINNGAIKI